MAKVLVVDDQRNMRTTLALMLGDAGYEVAEAYDGEHACDMVGGDAFDLADIGLTRARFVRVRDLQFSSLGQTTRGFDLDAIVLIHYERQ